ncbi:helix-turn-helix transcriptional regulator [Hymenobacter sp. ASUV-10]|uniref:Helix-turn-helix transcriptional regulator n=1 Tax=Hymenobacter aranciens TaxID=3063996 RepID=A0ABT9B7E9_9BACT|nr:helix-turn-helix transcriptional regulator [Hymenobacter sp. ASUV-10]MDO7874204.1 helix-turn-helix transcriptional regulator [Hymenobacter sp. ASUV-10]
MTNAEIITQRVAEIAINADQQPGVIVVINLQTRSVEYMSPRGLHLLETTMEELFAMGPAYHERFFCPNETDNYMPKIWDVMERRDFRAIVSFFQQVRTNQSMGWSWYFSSARLLACDEANQPLLLLNFSCPVDVDSNITAKVQRLLDENNFLRQHSTIYARLTPRERLVLKGLALGETSAETAQYLFISMQTVETHRRNLRQKLGVTSTFELGQYARAFDLI